MLVELLLAQKETFVWEGFFGHFLKLSWLLLKGISHKTTCDTSVQKKKQRSWGFFAIFSVVSITRS